ncbi:VOC family protein [Actinomadura viridis]|uniref:Enzyme related to lactoylglutathione lyase n=1 Tax=Actinomadura viridis TaxID=58110 RepID=A0A931DIP7_9ACTN|nr:VOC family protein [Actinomadura viridis]MBG6090097.1 putative enzyme related to lactoylglutathione lyase [Actinomadura viridis]
MTHMTTNAPTGTPNWLDLGIPDMERAKEFYGALFGWEFQDYGAEMGHYHSCLLRGEPVAGMMPNPEAGAKYWWGVYFATDDCDGTVKRVTDSGGTVVNAPDDVGDEGRMAVLKDPAGGQFGLWEGHRHIGTRYVGEPGSMVWVELVTGSPKEAGQFYRSVFGYNLEPIPGESDYTVLNRRDGQPVGGIQGAAPGTGPAWMTYFAVEDPDASADLVRRHGGTAATEPEDTPYGRMCMVKDPFGTEFWLMRPRPRE